MSNAFRGMRDQGEDDHDDLCVRGARNANSNKSTDELLAMLSARTHSCARQGKRGMVRTSADGAYQFQTSLDCRV